jgi:hypothetical protein
VCNSLWHHPKIIWKAKRSYWWIKKSKNKIMVYRQTNKIKERSSNHKPKLKGRTSREKPPAGSNKGSNSLKMSLSQSPPFWTSIPVKRSYLKSTAYKVSKTKKNKIENIIYAIPL